ncbi:MAG: hypothetical protein LBI87_01220 [Candidatus Accumulibacter sp.]|jgi:uncharacterized protein (DUF4415 family)|nr:hypothetical protein [Accumulibacter sp.]
MTTQATIEGTDEAWESGALGEDDKFMRVLSNEEQGTTEALVNAALGLQPISIRLEKSLIDDFRAIATINGLGYQTLMRQALKRFAEHEKKRLLNDVAAEIRLKESAKAPKQTLHSTRIRKAA